MAINPYFSQSVRSEQNLYEDIVIESMKIYGQDVYYLPRDIVNEDRILNEDVPSKFNSSYKVEMYIINTDGFEGEGDLFTKFGVEIRDTATFIVARRRWAQTVGRYDNYINSIRPREGDLIYLPLSNSLFQIMHVEHELPFYQLSNLATYQMRCELFEYNDENLDTGIEAIDDIETKYAYEYVLSLDSSAQGFTVGETVTQTLSSGTILTGEVSRWIDSSSTLGIIHLGASDGDFHLPVTGRNIVGTLSTVNVTAVTEDNQISENEQNNDFATLGATFLDFSETNPFGDPS